MNVSSSSRLLFKMTIIAVALAGCRRNVVTTQQATEPVAGTNTPNVVLGIGLSSIDAAGSAAYGIPRGHGWIVTSVAGREPEMDRTQYFTNSQLEQLDRDVTSGRISPDSALKEALSNQEAVARQTRALRDAVRLVEQDAISVNGRWSVYGHSGRISCFDIILKVDGHTVGPAVNDGNNMVGRALVGRTSGYRFKVEGLRVTSQALDNALLSVASGAALKPDKFEAWFVVPPQEGSLGGAASVESEPAPNSSSTHGTTTAPAPSSSSRRMWDPND